MTQTLKLTFTDDVAENIDDLVQKSGSDDRTELIKRALTVYDYLLSEILSDIQVLVSNGESQAGATLIFSRVETAANDAGCDSFGVNVEGE